MKLFRGKARTDWSREMDLSSGKRVRLTLHPQLEWGLLLHEDEIQTPAGVVWVDGDLTEGERWELEQLLGQDDLLSRSQRKAPGNA